MNATPTEVDIIVIGAGSGGLNIASFMNRVGFRVVLIDESDARIGGDCLNFGCVPSKALVHAARSVATAREAARYGLEVGGSVDWSLVRADIMAAQETIREHENAAWFRSKGMTVVLGRASFRDAKTVVVGAEAFTAKRIVLATGSRPRQLTTPGVAQVQVLNNESIFSVDTIPRSLLIVGAGPIGVEMASAFAHLGVSVTVVDPGKQVLGREDGEVAALVADHLVAAGVTLRLGTTLEEFTSATTARVTTADGSEETLSFEAVFASVGRVVTTEGLNLEGAGIRTDPNGKLVVDPFLRTTNKRVFVCGDVAGSYQFTHMAEMHAATILRNFFSPFKKPFSADAIAWVTFTTPEVATFGEREAVLKARGVPYEVLRQDFSEDDRAITDGYHHGTLLKLFVSPQGLLLGGTMVAPNAGELVQELLLLKSLKRPLTTLFAKVYPYPTATRINKRVAGTLSARRLTPLAMWLMRLLY